MSNAVSCLRTPQGQAPHALNAAAERSVAWRGKAQLDVQLTAIMTVNDLHHPSSDCVPPLDRSDAEDGRPFVVAWCIAFRQCAARALR